jgi:hypothetical protein
VFFIWSSFSILSLIFAYFLVPEMKGLTLEQVDKMKEEVPPPKSAAWVPYTTFAEQMRRINAAKAAGTSMSIGVGGDLKGQHYHHQYNVFHDPRTFQQYGQTPHSHQQRQHTCAPQHYQHTTPPQASPQQRSQHTQRHEVY